jgi:MoxR-like ATPase
MKYLSLSTVADSYQGCKGKTQNKFWGLLSILKVLDNKIVPGVGYTFLTSEVSAILDELFSFNEEKKDKRRGDIWSVMFSQKWFDVIPEIMFDAQPNIYDVAVWFFRKQAFPDDFNGHQVVDSFLNALHFTHEQAKDLFETTSKNITFENTLYTNDALLLRLFGNKDFPDLNKISLSFESGVFLKSNAGNLGQASFVQTLYSAQTPQRCLILTQFDFNEIYNKNSVNVQDNMNHHIQQIFYGAPGTGKSHFIKCEERVKEADKKNLVFRTTFHPDSDYSTFVGAYKPTMKPVPNQYKAVAGKDEEITYEFVPQAFLQAYIAAWNNPEENVFLVVEEINRGNCAQIFGDLFQLLDRDDDGYSEYPIKADRDLAKYLNGKDENGQEVLTNKDGIKDSKLKLPKNLYIWATMNTSDQSLFPIDSAFKRRWDWKYMPIENEGKNWKVVVNQHEYDWWDFLVAINKEVLDLTHSEDKQLGYFFAKAKGTTIDAETLVNKVYFYLWTDVFKDYDYESQKAFRKPNSNEPIAFKDFFEKGKVNEVMAEQVLINLELNKPKENVE